MNSPYTRYCVLFFVIFLDTRRAYLIANKKTMNIGNKSLCQRLSPTESIYHVLIGVCIMIYSIPINAATPRAKLTYTFLRKETCALSSSLITFTVLFLLFFLTLDNSPVFYQVMSSSLSTGFSSAGVSAGSGVVVVSPVVSATVSSAASSAFCFSHSSCLRSNCS